MNNFIAKTIALVPLIFNLSFSHLPQHQNNELKVICYITDVVFNWEDEEEYPELETFILKKLDTNLPDNDKLNLIRVKKTKVSNVDCKIKIKRRQISWNIKVDFFPKDSRIKIPPIDIDRTFWEDDEKLFISGFLLDILKKIEMRILEKYYLSGFHSISP
ncbi:MAG: hypothetical protein GF353_01515, partial [Candidatus Lokiarchaeota archaeon]|nr:hypothetical protein [Candidatus Lokiarchaeota archaeon]